MGLFGGKDKGDKGYDKSGSEGERNRGYGKGHVLRTDFRRLAVRPDRRMPCMSPGHQDASRRSALGCSGVGLREANALRREFVDVRRCLPTIAVAGQVIGAKRIHGHEKDVRFCRCKGSEKTAEDERPE